jgi:hypothetical protein
MNMISQDQIAGGQRKLLGGFLVAVAIAAMAIALAWGTFAVLNASKSVAPTLHEPGLLTQLDDERGGSVAAPAAGSTIFTDGLVEHRRGELSPQGQSVQKTGTNGFNGFGNTGYDLATDPGMQKTGTNGFNGFGNTGYDLAPPAVDPGMTEHRRGERGPLR